MKYLEYAFLILSIAIPLLFIVMSIINFKKIKSSKKSKRRILVAMILSFVINFAIFLIIKNVNKPKDTTKSDVEPKVVQTENKISDEDKERANKVVDESNKLLEANKEKISQESITSVDKLISDIKLAIESDDKETLDKKLEELNSTIDKMNSEISKSDSKSETKNTTTTKAEEKKEEPTTKTEEPVKTVENTSGTTSKGYKIETKDGITYVDGYLIVNKTYSLPEDYVPSGTHKQASASTEICQDCLVEEAYQAYVKLKSDAKAAGFNMWNQSGYRSYKFQDKLYNNYVKNRGQAAADTFSARAGHSEHQSGYAFDMCSDNYACISSGFNGTPPANWLSENCAKYGFILRYPKDKDNETGYKYESWHLRYVGEDLASKLYNDGDWITMESYFGITSAYQN